MSPGREGYVLWQPDAAAITRQLIDLAVAEDPELADRGVEANWLTSPALQRWLAERMAAPADDAPDTASVDGGAFLASAALMATVARAAPLMQIIAPEENKLAA